MGALTEMGRRRRILLEVLKEELDESLSPGRSPLQLKKPDFVKCLQSRESPSFLRFRDGHGQHYRMSSEGEQFAGFLL